MLPSCCLSEGTSSRQSRITPSAYLANSFIPSVSATKRLALFKRLLTLVAEGPPISMHESSAQDDLNSEIDWLRRKQVDSAAHLCLASFADSPEQKVYDAVWSAQRAALISLLLELDTRGISPIVMKGADATERYFGSRGFGLFNDVDLLVERPQLQELRRTLFGQGFRNAYFDSKSFALQDRDVRDIAAIEAEHYELAPFCKLVPLKLNSAELEFATSLKRHPVWVNPHGRPFVVVEFDVHFQIATDVDSAAFFQRSRIGIGGARSLSATDAVWFIAARYYTEVSLHGKTTLRELFYLGAALRRESIDWDQVLNRALELENAPALFYPLSLLGQWLPGSVPQELLVSLDPTAHSRDRDFGWQLGKLFDFVEDCPQPQPQPQPQRQINTTTAFEIAVDMQPMPVPCWASTSASKRLAYSVDPYFIDGWSDVVDIIGPQAERLLRGSAMIVFKPEAVVGRRIRPALSFLRDHGFVAIGSHRFRYTKDTIRTAWQYQLNIATHQRLQLVDILEQAADSLCVLLRAREVTTEQSASELLAALKGPADPRQRVSGQLRYALGDNALLINFVHTADEVADLIRELAIYPDAAGRQRLLCAVRDGTSSEDVLADEVRRLEEAFPQHDLDFDRSLDRLRQACQDVQAPHNEDLLLRLASLSDRPCPADWQGLKRAMDASQVRYCVWDLIVVGAHTTESNRVGLRPVLA